MGLLDFFRRKGLSATPAVVEIAQAGQLNTYRKLGGTNQRVEAAFTAMQSANYVYLYERQPAVRRVIDYIARNVAQLGLKLYERVDDTEREHEPDHPAAKTMAHPNDLAPADRFIFNLVAEYLIHDNAYVLKLVGNNGGPRTLILVPAASVTVNGLGRFTVESYSIYRNDGTFVTVPPEDVMHWHGYSSDPRMGISKLETLRMVLAEDAAAQAASIELSKSGLSKPGYIKRPLESPEWSEEARKRFQEAWANQSKSSPRKTPVLEEGMEFADFGVSPKDAEMLDSRRFTNDEVASLYGMEHCPPQDEEERKAFLADVLAPISQELCEQLDFSILLQEFAETDYYFEQDVNEKLRGDLENRFQAMTAAAGRPWTTVNEIRARENLPPIDTGDELTIPLNVMIGDNPRPAPNVMPPQDALEPPQDGSHREEARALPAAKQIRLPRTTQLLDRRERDASTLAAILRSHFARQEQVVTSKRAGTKAADDARWNTELAVDLFNQARLTVSREAAITAARMATGFDESQIQNYLEAAAEAQATDINRKTAKDIVREGVAKAFELAREVRAPQGGVSLATGMFALATRFATEQAPGGANRIVSVSGGSCDVCAPFQGQSTVAEIEAWPPYHPSCGCLAEVAA